MNNELMNNINNEIFDEVYNNYLILDEDKTIYSKHLIKAIESLNSILDALGIKQKELTADQRETFNTELINIYLSGVELGTYKIIKELETIKE